MCSWNENAQKNHYLMARIADFIKQLYAYFYLKKNEIVKTHKKYLLTFKIELQGCLETNQKIQLRS